jgi:hypothetical protein
MLLLLQKHQNLLIYFHVSFQQSALNCSTVQTSPIWNDEMFTSTHFHACIMIRGNVFCPVVPIPQKWILCSSVGGQGPERLHRWHVKVIEMNAGKESKLVKKIWWSCRQSLILGLKHIFNSGTVSRIHWIKVYKTMLKSVWMQNMVHIQKGDNIIYREEGSFE